MFAAAEALRPEMVMGECRLGSGGLEAVMVMFGGSACSMASQASGRSIHLGTVVRGLLSAIAQNPSSSL